ncbi:hypothetical protein EVAR_71323_1 [Eumeta japonica]|uniref:Uncharacterized protein n=1 Tax=Eumeta variegata TaxID=151549 RepID=A0A4C1T8I7_EUMVA|nr:hypothetical protein EVAR_71323_1 [Eumeta japonica]
MSSNSSLLSLNSSSNVNLSTKSIIDISNEITNNSDNTSNTLNNDVDNESNSNENIKNEHETKSIDKNEATNLKEELEQILPKCDEYENSEKQRANVTELFIDNFLNMEAIENSLISGGNDQSTSSLSDGGGTSRFSRWFSIAQIM